MQQEHHPRGLAVQVLTAVLGDGQPLDQALEKISTQHKLDSQSRAWLVDVSAGVLRWRGRLDVAIDSIALKKKPSGWLRKILWIGAYQLILQERVPAALVVSESVDEVKKKEGELPAKFVNALLRKISDSAQAWRELKFREKSSPADQAAWASLPDWFWKKLFHQQGVEWARAFAESSLERPSLWLRLAADVNESDSLGAGTQGPVPGSFQSQDGGAIPEKTGFAMGRFFVQDISSQFLIHEISALVKKSLGKETISALDLCAAPGGKSLGLAWNGFQVTSTDVDEQRLALIRENVLRLSAETKRMKGSVEVIARDQVASLPAQDLVWVDAPCTGSGIIRRHPDIRWLRKEKDLNFLSTKQEFLLKEAWEKVRSGGFLVYSVCSVFKEEGPNVIRACGLESQIRASWLLCPQEAPNGDGFWAVVLQK
jgi:16S rRNA (cytosine967-C5)-methyltransferase